MGKKVSSAVWISLLAILVTVGCSRNKELEQQNREQARVIADLNQQVANLQDEMSKTKSGPGASRTPGSMAGTQRSYIK